MQQLWNQVEQHAEVWLNFVFNATIAESRSFRSNAVQSQYFNNISPGTWYMAILFNLVILMNLVILVIIVNMVIFVNQVTLDILVILMNLVILSDSGDYDESGESGDYDESGESGDSDESGDFDESAYFWCIW